MLSNQKTKMPTDWREPNPQSDPYRVLMVISQPLLRPRLRRILDGSVTLKVVGDVESSEEAFALIESSKPDVVVTDMALRDNGRYELVSNMHAYWPTLGILVLTDHGQFSAGATRSGGPFGFLRKTCGASEVIRAVTQLARGQSPLSHRGRAGSQSSGSMRDEVKLTIRQLEILRHISHGYSTQEIAHMLGISPKGVAKHRVKIREALQASNTVGLTKYAVREGPVRHNEMRRSASYPLNGLLANAEVGDLPCA